MAEVHRRNMGRGCSSDIAMDQVSSEDTVTVMGANHPLAVEVVAAAEEVVEEVDQDHSGTPAVPPVPSRPPRGPQLQVALQLADTVARPVTPSQLPPSTRPPTTPRRPRDPTRRRVRSATRSRRSIRAAWSQLRLQTRRPLAAFHPRTQPLARINPPPPPCCCLLSTPLYRAIIV